MSYPLFEIKDCTINYGHIQAVKGVDLAINEGEIISLVGANGAGKTTTLLGISGILKFAGGQKFFNGRNITHLKPHDIVKLGIIHVPEGREILNFLTVMDNLHLGAYSRNDKKSISSDLELVLDMFPILKDRAKNFAGNLSGGELQMLAIARGLMGKPKILLLDEPSLGLAPLIVEEIFDTLVRINAMGITILLVEQNIQQALSISKYGYVLETGKIVLSDDSKNLLTNPKIIEAYLGS
jgi:branched-chain amino acid transport system ATP-binding protein